LAQRGLDPEKLTKNINAIDLARTFESLEPLAETDVEGYLRHEHEMIIVSAIEEGQKESVRQFEDRTFRSLESDWERTKRQIFEELGHQGADIYAVEAGVNPATNPPSTLAPRAFIKASVSPLSPTPGISPPICSYYVVFHFFFLSFFLSFLSFLLLFTSPLSRRPALSPPLSRCSRSSKIT